MIKKVYKFLKTKRFELSLTLFFLLTLADPLSMSYKSWGKAGVILWLLSFLVMFVVAISQIINLAQTAWKTKNFASLFSLLVILVLVAFNITRARSISGETTQEVACALEHIKKSIDWGYRRICFLGYPTRQYYLSALPSFLLGRNHLTLNLGGTLYFWLGISLFAAGSLKFNKFKTKQDLITGIGLISILHFYFFNHFLLNQYEQSNFPLSLGLAALGLYFLFRKTEKLFYLPLIGIVLHWLIYIYTPGLALLPLVIFLLFIAFFKIDEKKRVAFLITSLVIIVVTGINLHLSFKFRQDVRLIGEENPVTSLKPEAYKLLQHLTFKRMGEPFFSTSFSVLFWSTLIFSLILNFSLETIGLIAWILASIFIATFSRGYSYYHLAFRAHRALVIIPAFLYLLISLLTKIKIKKILLYCLYLLLLIDGFRFSQQYLNSRQPDPYLQVISSFEKNSNIEDEPQNILYFSQSAFRHIRSFRDFSQYFWPDTKIRAFSPRYIPSCLPTEYDYLVLNTDEACWTKLKMDLPTSVQVRGFVQTNIDELVLLENKSR